MKTLFALWILSLIMLVFYFQHEITQLRDREQSYSRQVTMYRTMLHENYDDSVYLPRPIRGGL